MKTNFILCVTLMLFAQCSKNSDSEPNNSSESFRKAWQFTFQVFSDYNHSTQLSVFFDALQIDPSLYSASSGFLNDGNFTKTTDRLQPGATYDVVFYEIMNNSTMNDCIQFAQEKGGLLTSVQGLTLGIMTNAGYFLVPNKDATFFAPDYETTFPTNSQGQVGMPVAVREGLSSLNYSWSFIFVPYTGSYKGRYLVLYFNK